MLSITRCLLGSALLFSVFFGHLHAAPTDTERAGLLVLDTVQGTPNLENIAVRHNGNILVTSVLSATIHQVPRDGKAPPVAVATIPGRNATLGIAELDKDIFYVIACDYGLLRRSNVEIWKLDMRPTRHKKDHTVASAANVSLAAKVPDAQLLNGLTRLARNDSVNLLAADSGAGTIYRIDTLTGEVAIVQQDATMASRAQGLGVGINGVHSFGSTLFYTSLDQGLFASVPISLQDGSATGPVTVIVNGTLHNADDFALSRDGGRAWIAENGINVVKEVDIFAKTSRVVANSTVLGSISSLALGRTCSDWDDLYITGATSTNGTSHGQVVKAIGLASDL